jgi:hypothetical protein
MDIVPMDKVSLYKWLEQRLSRPERRVTLVGHAGYSRPCPQCGKNIPGKGEIINLGKVRDKWGWVCLGCAPEHPYDTPQLKGVYCKDCDGLLTENDTGEKTCLNCAFWEAGCSRGIDLSCQEVTCCGFCKEGDCGVSAKCEYCQEYDPSQEVCCGQCEECTGELNWADYCSYCEIQYDIDRCVREMMSMI